jgi:exosortase
MPETPQPKMLTRYTSLIGLTAVLIWCYASDLTRLVGRWWNDSDYVYGFLVIPFAVFLLKRRWPLMERLTERSGSGGSLWGLGLVAGAILLRCASAYMSDPVFGPLSIVPCLAGVVLILGGWRALRWAWPAIVFLVFMIPLPGFLEFWGHLALQRVATVMSTFILQTIGIPSASYGNVIVMSDGQLSVAAACSGLRSTMLFFAVSTAAAFLVEGIPEKITVLLSAIPATIAANVFRIASTGILHELAGAELADAVFHDLFGFLMLPLASLIVWGEIGLIRRLLIHENWGQGPLPLPREQLSSRA